MEQRSVVSKNDATLLNNSEFWTQCLNFVLLSRAHPTSGVTELFKAVAAAELTGALSQFHALGFQAIFAMGTDSEFAGDYLKMAESLAASPAQVELVSFWRGLQLNPCLPWCASREQHIASPPSPEIHFPAMFLGELDQLLDDLVSRVRELLRAMPISSSKNATSTHFERAGLNDGVGDAIYTIDADPAKLCYLQPPLSQEPPGGAPPRLQAKVSASRSSGYYPTNRSSE